MVELSSIINSSVAEVALLERMLKIGLVTVEVFLARPLHVREKLDCIKCINYFHLLGASLFSLVDDIFSRSVLTVPYEW